MIVTRSLFGNLSAVEYIRNLIMRQAPDGGTVTLEVMYNGSNKPALILKIEGRYISSYAENGSEKLPVYTNLQHSEDLGHILPDKPFELVNNGTEDQPVWDQVGFSTWQDFVENGTNGLAATIKMFTTSARVFNLVLK